MSERHQTTEEKHCNSIYMDPKNRQNYSQILAVQTVATHRMWSVSKNLQGFGNVWYFSSVWILLTGCAHLALDTRDLFSSLYVCYMSI